MLSVASLASPRSCGVEHPGLGDCSVQSRRERVTLREPGFKRVSCEPQCPCCGYFENLTLERDVLSAVDWVQESLRATCLIVVCLCCSCTLPDIHVRPGEARPAQSGTDSGAGSARDKPLRDAALDDAAMIPQQSMGDAKTESRAAKAPAGGGGGARAAVIGDRSAAGSNGTAPEASSDDAGAEEELSALALTEYANMRRAQERAITSACDCYAGTAVYPHRMACEANWGLHQPGQAGCIADIITREPIEAIRVTQCKAAAFESLSQCFTFELDCSNPRNHEALEACMDKMLEKDAECPKYQPEVKAKLNVCYAKAEAYWAYVDDVYAHTEVVCRCHAALGYDSLDACRQGEGIGYSEFAALETCFFELDGKIGGANGERASASAYYACDGMRRIEYATCMRAVASCDASAAMGCKNSYHIDRAVCRNEAHFLRDPYEECGQ